VSDEDQVTCVVRSWVVASLKVPITPNGTWVPAATVGSTGRMSSDSRVASVTVSVVEVETKALGRRDVGRTRASVVVKPQDPGEFEMSAVAPSDDAHKDLVRHVMQRAVGVQAHRRESQRHSVRNARQRRIDGE
jgi:hypothetical protein